jgi:thiamine-phosphate pyrophosphorylase
VRIVVISPESADDREVEAMGGFFAAGLERYHVRKPSWAAPELEAWLRALPAAWRPRLVLHQHPALAGALGLCGRHDRDTGADATQGGFSRSCHDLAALRRSMGSYEQVLFGPVFASFSKPGHAPAADFPWDEVKALLTRERPSGSCRVLAIGGITAARLERCAALGFDGAAVMGAVWDDPDPVQALGRVLKAAGNLEGARHAA